MAKVTKMNTQKFDTSKSYQWKPEDSFEITGLEFDFLQNFFTREVMSPEGNVPLDKVRGYNIMQELLKNAVEQGVAIPVPEDTPKDLPKQEMKKEPMSEHY